MKHLRPLVLMLLFMFSLSVQAANYNREDILRNALKNNPKYMSAIQESKSAFWDYAGSYGGFLPGASFGYTASDKTLSFDNKTEGYTFSAGINLFSGFSTYHSVRSYGAKYDSAKSGENLELLNLVRDVYVTYQQVLKSQYIMAGAESSFKSADLVLREAEEKQKLDILTKAELYKAQADREKAYATFLEAQTGYATLLVEMGFMSGLEFDLNDIFNEVEDTVFVLHSLDDYLSISQEYNPSLLQVENSLKVSQYSHRSSFSRFLPSLDLDYVIKWDNPDGYHPDKSVRLTATWNVFNGFSDISGTLSRSRSVNAAQYKYVETKEQVRKVVITQWMTVQSLEKQIKSAELYVAAAQENYIATQEMFTLGRSTLKDTIDARKILEDAQATLANTKYQRVQAYADLMVATGGYYADSNIKNMLK